MALENILLAEFKRLVKNGKQLRLVSQQQTNGYYAILAIDTDSSIGYSVRHARENKPRTWRLDRLGELLHDMGVKQFEVRGLY
ncbi:hypothetical protein [Vibrio marisflavi]|uniref:Uncharacterized protein n=1 Tax=Vibrio marisflavi CECT 7928 TaxID=634439 RepID=A0ABN8EAC6_9VIBR|nr:hypothetical protein [Vibrio marisflavi]CAH0542983.1 hypothetical protein VMF7928_04345 [Vibrio marisflavi CECT 7928]